MIHGYSRAGGDLPEQATQLRPAARSPFPREIASAFPSDLFEQARGRLQLLAACFLCAFAFDLLIFLITFLVSGRRFGDAGEASATQWANLSAVVLSISLWLAARSPRLPAARLHTLGLLYEVAICSITALLTNWQYYRSTGLLPHLTWVPAIVIMFPLILPGPPRRMLLAAMASGATGPLSLWLLEANGAIAVSDSSSYVQSTVASIFAVAFAYLGSRVIYGLGREIARAREMGSYQLVEPLGEGGMGEVWRARHRLLARDAAVKLIRPSLLGGSGAKARQEVQRRFEREAQAIAGLRSPHTINLFDFGVSDEGKFYYAMELLDGFDTDKLVRRFGPFPAARAVHLLRQACHSLSEAESCGLVHRDIKPSNIYLCRYGEEYDFVKVLDFGMVKTSYESADGDASVEQAVRGTPAFMAPEQALGTAQLDGRADIYSLGCVAYWLLTGTIVFNADTPTAMLMAQIQAEPTPPSSRSELPVPTDLDDIVMACLAKRPKDRPPSARELSRRLAAVQDIGVWTSQEAREWWEEHVPAIAHAAD